MASPVKQGLSTNREKPLKKTRPTGTLPPKNQLIVCHHEYKQQTEAPTLEPSITGTQADASSRRARDHQMGN